MARKAILILAAFLLLGFLIRVYRIASLPMYGDELTMVYDTYSILKTGMDQTGQRFPLTFTMGAGRPGGYVYFSVPFVAAFGPTVWGVRSLSLLSGLGIIVLSFFLVKKLFGEKAGLIAAFIASVSPWDIYLSRGGFEAHFALFLALSGIVAFLYAGGKKWLYILWAVLWGLSIHTYPTFKLTLPLMFLILLWYTKVSWKIVKDKIFIMALVILAIFGALAIKETIWGKSEERFLSINVFANQDLEQKIVQLINSERTMSTLPEPLKLVYFNKPFEYTRTLYENYMKNISFDFLFLRGDGNPRHNPAEFGMLYLIELLLFFLGMFYLWSEKRRELILILSWILIVPLATMFLSEAHGLRNDLMIPPFIMITSFALSKLSKTRFTLCILLIFIQLAFILGRIYFLAPTKFAEFWSFPAMKASESALAKRGVYKTVYLSDTIDNIEFAYPVYAQIDPRVVIDQYGKYPKVYGNVTIVNLKSFDLSKIGTNSLIISE